MEITLRTIFRSVKIFGIPQNVPVGFEFERNGYPVTDAEVMEEGFEVRADDMLPVMRLIKAYGEAASDNMQTGTEPLRTNERR